MKMPAQRVRGFVNPFPGLVLPFLLLVSCIETKARLVEQRDRDYSLVLDLTGFILGFIPGLLVLFLVSVRTRPYRPHLWIRSYPQRGLYLFFLTEGKLRRRK